MLKPSSRCVYKAPNPAAFLPRGLMFGAIDRKDIRMRVALLISLVFVVLAGCTAEPPEPEILKTFKVFEGNTIHFAPDDSLKFETATTWPTDAGREINGSIEIPDFNTSVRILAKVTTRPIPRDIQDVHDPWDRAGHVRLETGRGPAIEIIKFITAYGGLTTHELDVSYLAPFLKGGVNIVGFVDTWVSPGWEMDFDFNFLADRDAKNPVWGKALFNNQDLIAESPEEGPLQVEIPPGLSRVVLHVLVSGHCTDGRGADEFETKDHVISVDGNEVKRFRPWRDDCLQFRSVNPYTRRWSDGSWSSDYSRSGWCPGDKVVPTEFDLTGVLAAGSHTLDYRIEDIRPKNTEGNFGYWRVSAYLLGW